MRGLLLEGVTGAGKSQTLRALARLPAFAALLGAGRVFPEEETLGEFMAELTTLDLPPAQRLWRLWDVLAELERAGSSPGAGYVLERFHLSYYALLPAWDLYAELDHRLGQLGCLTVLLVVEPEALAARSLDRVDRRDTSWTDDMVGHYGSRAAALEAIASSQERRRAALRLSGLPSHVLDTTGADWDACARTIVGLWQAHRAGV